MSTPDELSQELKAQRRTVDFDTFDIQLQELLRNLEEGQISVAPAYQRQFRWDKGRCSELIESLMLGIPVPNLFMATNDDNTWETVDGVQRLSAIVKFAGNEELRAKLGLGSALALDGLKKLRSFNGLSYSKLPDSLVRHLKTRPLRVVTLNDKSDKIIRFDLFERLNTGGISLTNQEIRDCVFQGEFADLLDELAQYEDFRKVVRVSRNKQSDGTLEECVLRFFAFSERYREFEHSVEDFLTDYMQNASRDFDYEDKKREFKTVFAEMAAVFPGGLRRPGGRATTPLNLYEGVAVGAALALRDAGHLDCDNVDAWLDSDVLRGFTTGGTNTRQAVAGRIEFCRDQFLGVGHVSGVEE